MALAARAVVLSGGAEIVGAAVAEALERARIPYAVIGLTPGSILRRARGAVSFADLSGLAGDPGALRDRLLDCLAGLHAKAQAPIAAFATEDGGLRCLNEFADDVRRFAEFPRARALRLGGLDKAELFSFLATSSARHYMPATEIISDLADAGQVLDRLGDEAIFKPALKPWDMELRGMAGAKVVTRKDATETRPELLRRLAAAWPLSQKWVVQSRLRPYAEGERGVWSVRGQHDFMPIQFVERWKYPAQGGTGCLVETQHGEDLLPAAASILEALDYIGLSELPFLQDEQGLPRMLEINARAWLQEALAEKSGLPMVRASVELLTGQVPTPFDVTPRPTTWINLERAWMAALTGEAGARGPAIRTLLREMRRHPEWAIYSSTVRGVRPLWMRRLAGLGWKRLWKTSV